MKITIESTSRVVEIVVAGGVVPARVWEGETDSGIKVQCLITRIAAPTPDGAGLNQFAKELLETREPSADFRPFPLRMIL